jgi:SAM-dependent methyltransferase
MNDAEHDLAYTGGEVLETMAAAVRYNRFLVDQIVRNAGGSRSAVDFGAGIGTLAGMVRSQGLQITCVETDARQREELIRQGFGAHASLAAIPPNTVDYVYSINVLEHIPAHLDALKEIVRALKPGGRCLIYVPAFQILYSPFDRAIGHIRRYRRLELRDLLLQAGFGHVSARYCDSLGFAAALAYKLIGPGDGKVSESSVAFYDRVAFPMSLLLDSVLSRVVGKNVLAVATKN